MSGSPDVLDRCRHGVETDLHLSGEKIDQRGAAAAIGHMHHVYAGHRFKQRAEEVGRVPVPGDAMLTLPGLALA